VLAQRSSRPESRYRWFVASSRVAGAQADPDEALRLLDLAEQHYRPGFFPAVRPIPAMRARVWISSGNLAQASEWARGHELSDAGEVSFLAEFDQLTLVRLAIARYRVDPGTGPLDPVVGLLDRMQDAADRSGRAGSLVEIRLLQALAHQALGHGLQALECLDQAWAGAPEPEGLARIFLDEGAPMLELLREAEREAERHGASADHARRLLRLGSAAERDGGQAPVPVAGSVVEPLSERELQVLRLLDSELTGPQIARELFVSHNTVRTHTKHIFTKLAVTSRRAAVRRAREQGLL